MKDYQISRILLQRFIGFMEEWSPDERLWLIHQFTEYFCEECGEEILNCLCPEKDE